MKIDRVKVYQKCNGHCAYCGCEITIKQMQIDHVFPQLLSHHEPEFDKNRFANLMPSCHKCNNHKGGMKLEFWRSELQRQVKMLHNNSQFMRALRYGQIAITETPIVFYFEKPPLDKGEKLT
jgi:CRISPR/Cas system Type II protein with McrA/HNH and RuvC-like nuclease domain